MSTATKTAYTTEGSVRGCCGHKHRSVETAQRCIERDRAGCRSQGGYSDRRIVDYLDGSTVDFDEYPDDEYGY